jgi:polar amino acid transport system substrate-binding protein
MRRSAAAAVLVMTFCAASAHADLPEIQKTGVLRVVAVSEEAPEMFNFAATGEPGFEREMIEGFARLHDLKMEAVKVPTANDRIPALDKGEGDVIIGIIVTEPRKKLVDFTVETLPARHLVLTYAPHRVVNTLDEFRSEKVGVVKGTSWSQAAIEAGIPSASLMLFPERYSALDALRDGKISATVMSLSDYTLATRKYPQLQAGLALGPPSSAAFAVRKSDPKLLAALNQYLSDFRQGPSWSRLVVKYFGPKALAVLGRASK